MTISPQFAATVGDRRADAWRDEPVPSRNCFVLTKRSTASVRLRTAHEPFGLSSEFHAYGAAPGEVGNALACFDAEHVPYFMLMTGWLGCSPASLGHRHSIARDPKRMSANISRCSSEAGFSPYQGIHLTRYDTVSGAKGRICPYADAKRSSPQVEERR